MALVGSGEGVGTTSAHDSTGANFSVIIAAYDSGATITDSKGNVHTPADVHDPGTGDSYSRIYYCSNPIVGPGHTASLSIGYGWIALLTFDNVGATTLEAQNGASVNPNTTLSTGNVHPLGDNRLIIAALCLGGAAANPTINSGFTLGPWRSAASGSAYGGGAAYLQQTTGADVNPAWSWGNSSRCSGGIAVFTTGGGGGGSGTLTSASVNVTGTAITATFDAAATPSLASLSVTVDGVPFAITSVSGGGTSWTLAGPIRWIRAGAVVSVVHTTATVTATNSSTVTDQQVRYVGRHFGMFVHWGLETWADVEWSTGVAATAFNPTSNIGEAIDTWIKGAQLAGMRYIVLTAKHHSGFCLWPSATTTYDIAASTWYGANGSPDVLKIFTSKCRAAGLGVGVYFSGWDRKFEADNPSFTGPQYTTFLQNQLTEILTGYGPIDVIWIDGYGWAGGGGLGYATVPFASIYSHIKGLQPACQVLINNHENDLSHTDIVAYEGAGAGFEVPTNNALPCEQCDTIRADAAWFWKTTGDSAKSAATLISTIATMNGRRATYMLNCPPNRTGKLPDITLQTLASIGASALEAVEGPSSAFGAGAYAQRTISITLTDAAGTPRASLAGLKWTVKDARDGNLLDSGTGATTDASGVFVIHPAVVLASGAVVWLEITDSDGTTTQTPVRKAVVGPVALT